MLNAMSGLFEAVPPEIRRLLSLDGPEFLGQAYLLMLGRPIDPDGFRNYDSQLRAGASKLAIVVELGASKEACRHAGTSDRSAVGRAAVDALSPPPAVNIRELLAHDDIRFVFCAYRTLLGRLPDAAGLDSYLEMLRRGRSKLRIVWQLSRSGEARAGKRALSGYRGAMLNFWLANNLATGWLYRAITHFESDSPLECRLRAIEAILARLVSQQEQWSREIDGADQEVAALLRALSRRRAQ